MAAKEEEGKEVREVKTTPIEKPPTRTDVEATRGETFVSPDVDIHDTDEALALVADVPGVARDGVELKLEDGVLEITAHRTETGPEEPDHQEYRRTSYYRAFSLSEAIDAGKIEAKLADGILTVTLPKSPKAKPRKIEVTSG